MDVTDKSGGENGAEIEENKAKTDGDGVENSNLPAVPVKQVNDGDNSAELSHAKSKPTTSTDATGSKHKEDRRSGFAAVKSEFLVRDYKPKLHPQYVSVKVKHKLLSSNGEGEDSGSIAAPCENEKKPSNFDADDVEEPPKKKAKLKGRNKHRPRNERIQAKDRMCPAVKAGRDCAYGEKCKFNHNIQDFLDKKMPDLDKPCPVFEVFGFCHYGVACRFAKSHLNDKLENVTNKELYEKMKGKMGCQNVLNEDVKHKLWKRKFNFKKADHVVKEVQRIFRDAANSEHSTGGKIESGDAEQEKTENATTESVDNKEDNLDDDINQSVNEKETDTLSVPSIVKDRDFASKAVCEVGTAGKSPVVEKTLGPITDEEVLPLRPVERTKVDFKNKLFLAPLTTVGNLPFRRLCKGFGAEITCGEMAVASQLLKGKQSEWSLIKRHPCEDIFGVQICGSYPDSMTRCAQVLLESSNIDFIDINCGCPIDLIFKKGCGCALMGKATRLEQICRSMMGVMGDTPLTVKIRTGVFDKKNVAHTLIPRLRDAGVSLMTVHGRSREQRYTRLADWDYISQCATAGSPMPVFGNGDILSYEDANLHMEQNNVSGVMIARGALIKPWIFTEIKEQRHWDISSSERFDMLRSFTNYGLEHWGSDHQGVENTRRFLLEWLSFLHRYIPVGVLEQVPQRINERPPYYIGRNDLETLMASANCADWVKISEMLLGPVPESFQFLPKHKANAYQ